MINYIWNFCILFILCLNVDDDDFNVSFAHTHISHLTTPNNEAKTKKNNNNNSAVLVNALVR